jgi:predicted transcriptional regulator/plasmid stabilization system protein ParE
MPTESARPTKIRIDHHTKQRLKRIAARRDRSPHSMITEAIRQFLEREEKREAFYQDGLKAWQAYRTSGLHVASEEADAWLAQLESGQDEAVPPCHTCFDPHLHSTTFNASIDSLAGKNLEAAKRVVKAIRAGVKLIERFPETGRPAGGMEAEFREWLISSGDSGYVVLYRFDGHTAVILAVRHQKEAGYH